MARRFLSSAGLLVMIIAVAGCSGAFSAPDPTPMGTPVEAGESIILTPEAQMAGVLRQSGEIHTYRFTGTVGEAVTVDMYAPPMGDLDTYLVLVGPDGTELTNDDDGGSGSDSRIENFVLPEDGEYQIEAHSYRQNTRGSYSLVMDLGTPFPTATPVPTVPPGGGAITLNETRTGGLNVSGQVDYWEFAGQAGDIITVDMRRPAAATDLDPYLVLLDAADKVLAEDDDSGTDLDSRIANFRLPTTGMYTIRAEAVDDSTGSYLIAVTEGVPPTPVPASPTPGPSPTPFHANITLNSAMDAAIRAYSDGNYHTLTIDAPTTIEIVVQPEYDVHGLYLDMTGPDGTRQDLEDYRSASPDQQAPYIYIPAVVLPEPGAYVFHVRSRTNIPLTYTLSLQAVAASAQPGGGELQYGQSVSGAIRYENAEDRWTFAGQSGDVISIFMRGDTSLDSYLTLIGPGGQELMTADNRQYSSSGQRDAEIVEFSLSTSGSYVIVASGAARRNSIGQYRLSLLKTNE